jgi:tripartite-type tricarboxylate transporter receptor subunit TctC
MNILLRTLGTGLALALSLSTARAAYPDKPIHIVVPFAAGGGVDILTRVLAQNLSDSLHQPVIVEDRPGAGGNLGMDYVAKAAPDGYTVAMATTGTQEINPGLYSHLPYDAVKSFSPVTLVASVPNVLVVNERVPAKSLKELIALAKAQPGKLSFASFGNGTSNHLSGELLKQMAGINVLHVPYKKATQAVTDLISGQVSFAFVNMPLALPHVHSGQLRALAVTGAQRSGTQPQLPTMSEAGLPGFVVESWYGLMAPAHTPPEVVQHLRQAVLAALAKPEVKAFFGKQGADVVTSTPEELATMIKKGQVRWAKIIKDSGAHVD